VLLLQLIMQAACSYGNKQFSLQHVESLQGDFHPWKAPFSVYKRKDKRTEILVLPLASGMDISVSLIQSIVYE
jgi:hypothetical protein